MMGVPMRRAMILAATTILPILTIPAMQARAQAPPQITWEWFNAAETYLAYKVKGPNDLAIAAHYFRLAASHGNAAAAYKLGEAYENGSGVAQDAGKALAWYREAASRGDRYAELRIGWFYQKGIAVATDGPTAVSWYEKAASHDNLWAYHMLAVMYAEGEGVPRNLDAARRCFEISLPYTHDAWAMWRLSQLLEDRDPKRQRSLLVAAAKAGSAQAIEDLKSKPAKDGMVP